MVYTSSENIGNKFKYQMDACACECEYASVLLMSFHFCSDFCLLHTRHTQIHLLYITNIFLRKYLPESASSLFGIGIYFVAIVVVVIRDGSLLYRDNRT